jgi:membrane-associated phospholipid phosphatase
MSTLRALPSVPTDAIAETNPSVRFRRRTLLGLAAGGSAALAFSHSLAPSLPSARAQTADGSVLSWRTWILKSADELRPEAPGDPSQSEMDEILSLQSKRSYGNVSQITQWGTYSAVIPWAEVGIATAGEAKLSGIRDMRVQAILRAAMYDAVLAAYDAQAAHPRRAPALADSRVTPHASTATGAKLSFPSVHATVAGAASTVLAALFPDAPAGFFADMAQEAAESRIMAGESYRSDVVAGLELGRAVGSRAVDYANADGSDAKWDGTGQPTGDGYWQPTPPANVKDPVEPLANTWKLWFMPSADALRPAIPPAYGSLGWQAELDAVRRIVSARTIEQERIIDRWLQAGPHGMLLRQANELITAAGTDEAHAAQVVGLMGLATMDAVIGVWDAKYKWWTARPITEDPTINTYFQTPPYPSYPSGFSAVVGASASVLAQTFPEASIEMLAMATEGAAQRCWAGIHYILDDDVGLQMGCCAGRMAFEKGLQDTAGA